jgi:hypothetical protein
MNELGRQQRPPTEAAAEERKSNWLDTIINPLVAVVMVCVTLVMIPVMLSVWAYLGLMKRLGLVDPPPVAPNNPDGRNSNWAAEFDPPKRGHS